LKDEDSELLEDSDINSSSSSSDEFIDDDFYIQRHLNLEIEEIRRYNIGIKSEIHKEVDERIETLIAQ
jgi:hypothetical protein